MTDRELLELAAKAAGIWSDTDHSNGMLKTNGQYWNPLTDDGDALRLAVKLRICIFIGTDTVEAYTNKEDGKLQINEGDFFSATRRAIVRAAAEIGKTL